MRSKKNSTPVRTQYNPQYHVFCIGAQYLNNVDADENARIIFRYEENKSTGVKRNWVEKSVPIKWVFQHLTGYRTSKWNKGDFYCINENLIFNYKD